MAFTIEHLGTYFDCKGLHLRSDVLVMQRGLPAIQGTNCIVQVKCTGETIQVCLCMHSSMQGVTEH